MFSTSFIVVDVSIAVMERKSNKLHLKVLGACGWGARTMGGCRAKKMLLEVDRWKEERSR